MILIFHDLNTRKPHSHLIHGIGKIHFNIAHEIMMCNMKWLSSICCAKQNQLLREDETLEF
jgi:hypothetical protein